MNGIWSKRVRVEEKKKTLFLFFRLSSVDTKYHIWKMGVVFTDNVRLYKTRYGWMVKWVVRRLHRLILNSSALIFLFISIFSHSSI